MWIAFVRIRGGSVVDGTGASEKVLLSRLFPDTRPLFCQWNKTRLRVHVGVQMYFID